MRAAHKHTAPGQHEHEFEPQYGLPEVLPTDERLLWQGAPDWKLLAMQRFHVRKLVIYFAVLLAARLVALISDGMPVGTALAGSVTLFSLSAVAVGLVTLMAWLTARTTVYTLTDKRVVMRIGIVLTLTLNLPLRRIQAAGLQLHSGSSGDIALQLRGTDRVAFVHLWPHARRWHLKQPEPTLLCVPDAQRLAQQLTDVWQTASGEMARAQPASPQTTPLPTPVPTVAPSIPGSLPSLATR